MIIYEVNLSINKDIYDQFLNWLRTHVAEMLQFDGFRRAQINEEIQTSRTSNARYLTIRYGIDSWTYLERYLKEDAETMRNNATERFKDQFIATRRIFNILDTISANKQMEANVV